MPAALSGGPLLYTTFTPSTVADILTALDGIIVSVGGVATLVTGGTRYLLTSPQSLQVNLFVRDLGHTLGPSYGPTATLQFQTTDTLITGIEQELVADGREYQVVAGPSQLFISLVGIPIENQGGTFAGGIPFFPLAAACGTEVPALAATQGFWSMGDFNGGTTPRDTLIMGDDHTNPDGRVNCEALFNSSYCAAGNAIGSVRIPALVPASLIFQAFNVPSPTLYWNGDELHYEPALVWGDTSATLPNLKAQIWDALIFSRLDVLDHIHVFESETYISFTHNYQYGSLNLLLPPTFNLSGGNYSYIAT